MKKINPRKRPASMADVERAKKEATSEAISLSIALFLTVMVDKFGYDADKLKTVWDEINKLSQSVTDGYVNLHDLKQVLIDEYGIELS
jgi:hypothetical protein